MERAGRTLIERLAAFGLGVQRADMQPEDIAAIRRLVLDTLGCALGAVGCEPARLLRPLARAPLPHERGATRIGDGERVRLADAVLFNGALVRYLDFMDVYWARDICHPSENIPVALAAAEAHGASGAALIEAVAAAYELQVRLADAFSLEGLALHHVSAAGFIAPLIFARFAGLGVRETAHAMALGGFRHLTSAALVQGHLSMAKALGYAWPASECVDAVQLAAAGFTGPLATLEAMGVNHFDVSPGTGSARRVSLKAYPVQFSLQAPIEAALRLRERLGDRARDLERVQVDMPAAALRRTADAEKLHPTNRETADHSLPCCVAMALVDGRLDARGFEQGRWQAPEVRALMARIACEPSARLEAAHPGGRPVRLTAQLRDGTREEIVVAVPAGDATSPLPDAQVLRKFLDQAQPVLGPSRSEALAAKLVALDSVADVRELAPLWTAPAR